MSSTEDPADTLLKWVICLPAASLAGFSAYALIWAIGKWLVSDWAIPSAIVLFVGVVSIPIVWMAVGLRVAPKKNSMATSLLLAPLILLCFLSVGALLALLLGQLPMGYPSSSGEAFNSLSLEQKGVIIYAAFSVGTIFIAIKTLSEVVTRSLKLKDDPEHAAA